ncbi:PLP-dependent cysteine synthase family protein [Hyperthermus butylicus]|uniref:Cysteine synthase n=1 Tax=Hyperthermus butylicus (strain DSM 5456 / JCM 9403 / PLM1-5) TaxID=415426 RepID=A2BN44_HYPBU|nr:PLP-dependent cysteine synthase family protein [Hyperthermus butylicus]ABM81405.1 Cysteine synthase [Hyperthermus butylicus DSM 5456]
MVVIGYKIVDIKSITPLKPVELQDVLDTITALLSAGNVYRTIAVDASYRVAEEDSNMLYWALNYIGVKRVPISYSTPINITISLEELGFYDDINPEPLRVFKSSLELLYRNWPTPLVRLESLSTDGYRVWAKLEWYNPYSMSVKDRIGWYMIVRALETGWRGREVYETTSTNTGMALAAMGAIHGFRVKLWIPKTIQKASDVLLKALGAEVIRTDKQLTVDLIEDVKTEAKRSNALHVDQFNNDANFLVHLKYTAKELELQLKHAGVKPKGIIGGLGTSGHLAALTLYFRSRMSGIRVYGVQPARGEVIPGIRRIETGMKWVHWAKPDNIVEVKRCEAIEALLRVARRDGILPGLSSGAVAAAFLKLLEKGEIEPGDYILIFPDNGFKYVEQLSEYFAGKGGDCSS